MKRQVGGWGYFVTQGDKPCNCFVLLLLLLLLLLFNVLYTVHPFLFLSFQFCLFVLLLFFFFFWRGRVGGWFWFYLLVFLLIGCEIVHSVCESSYALRVLILVCLFFYSLYSFLTLECCMHILSSWHQWVHTIESLMSPKQRETVMFLLPCLMCCGPNSATWWDNIDLVIDLCSRWQQCRPSAARHGSTATAGGVAVQRYHQVSVQVV